MLGLFLSIYSFSNLLLTSECSKLIFAHVLWRHGARSTSTTYPTSLYQDSFWVPGPRGELLAQGMDEHARLAIKLKQRYMIETRLVSSRYKPSEVYVRSTDVNRTIVSAMAHMAAFYYAQGIPGLDYPLNWQWPAGYTPVPVHTVALEKDYVLSYYACERAVDLQRLAEQTPEFSNFSKMSEPLMEYLTNYTGMTVDTIAKAYHVCDVIVTEETNHLFLTAWQKRVIPACQIFFAEVNSFWFGWNTAPFRGHDLRTELPQIIGGKLLFDMITRMRQKYENYVDSSKNEWISDLKYYAYSGHDSGLVTLAALFDFEHLDFDQNTNPATSNAYSIELWIDDDNNPFVKVLYWRRDSFTYLDLSRNVGGCKFTKDGCSLDEFLARSIKYKQPDDFDEFCHSRVAELTS